MRLLITIAVVSLALTCYARPADDDYAYEDDAPAEPAAAPAPKPPARHALVNSRTARGPSPLIGSRGVKTTAAPPKPAEPEVVNEPEVVDEEAAEDIEEAPAVTTEAPKKGLSSRGAVRPFRSNQDLLAALKRKRQQEHNVGGVSTHPPPATSAPDSKTTSKAGSRSTGGSTSGGRRSYSRPNNKATPAASETSDEQEAPKKPSFGTPSRRFSGRGKPAAPAPVNEDPEGEEEEPAPRASKAYRGGRRL